VTCAEFDRWLDEGQPRERLEAMSAHATSCARCMRALAAALEVDALLASPDRIAGRAPADFTERVMNRVIVTPQISAAPISAPARLGTGLRSGPLWLRAVSDPAVVLALLVAALVAWRGPALVVAAPAAALALAGRAAALFSAPRLVPPGVPDWARLGVMIAALPPLAWLGWRLFRATEAVAARVARHP